MGDGGLGIPDKEDSTASAVKVFNRALRNIAILTSRVST